MKPLKVLDLFAGGGGFSTGFLNTNSSHIKFEISKAVEIDPAACKTLEGHLGKDKVIQGDITKRSIKEKIYRSCSSVDVIIGGPPCQTFSLAGPARSGTKEMREKLKNDPRNTLYKHFFEIVERIKPKFVVFENVEGLLSKKIEGSDNLKKKHEQVIELICDELESKGYRTNIENSITDRFQVLNAADFGVPQHRKRIIIIANRLGLDNPKFEPNPSIPYETIGNAIKHLPVRLPKITLSEKLKSKDKIIEYYNRSLTSFMSNLQALANKELLSNSRQGLRHLYESLLVEYNRIKDKKTYKFQSLKKFINLYNELILEYKINDYEEDKNLINHKSRDHNFRDIIIFIETKPGSNSSRFMNKRFTNDYNKFLDDLYPYNKNKHKDTYVKQSWVKPSNTILAHMEKDGLKFIHPEQPRTLTPYEAQLIQSFPKDYVFSGGRNNQYRQIGNAVPPQLAEVIGESILELYLKSENTHRQQFII